MRLQRVCVFLWASYRYAAASFLSLCPPSGSAAPVDAPDAPLAASQHNRHEDRTSDRLTRLLDCWLPRAASCILQLRSAATELIERSDHVTFGCSGIRAWP
jgi:hypothetical protein